jgi:hypothetical protein
LKKKKKIGKIEGKETVEKKLTNKATLFASFSQRAVVEEIPNKPVRFCIRRTALNGAERKVREYTSRRKEAH